MRLYVGNLSFKTTEADLNDLFSQVGTVENVRIITDRDTGRSRGFAFVEYASNADGEAAIQRFEGAEFMGRNLKVNEAKPMENRGGGGGGGRGRGSRDRGGYGGGGYGGGGW
jgi:RNA recognition motif-containing protein